MRIFLLIPPYIKGLMRNARWDAVTISGSNWYPIFMAYCTGLLEKHGHVCKLVDAQVDGLSREQVYAIVEEFKPDLLVLYFSMKCLENDLAIGDEICRRAGCEGILVGHAASMNPEMTLLQAKRVNMLALGEFDFTVLDVANGVPKKEIRGLVREQIESSDRGLERSAILRNPPREPIPVEELDKYPFVTSVYKKHLHIENYRLASHRHPYVDLFTGRGCAWGWCSFCLWPHTMYGSLGPSYRPRSIGNVIEELRYIKRELPQVKDVYFQDDVMPKTRMAELSKAILDAGLKLRWSCYSRADLDLETLQIMKKAGCHMLEVGLESSSPIVLARMKKGLTVPQMGRFLKDAKKAKVDIIGAFITGMPGDTVESIKATTEWLIKQPILRGTITLPKAYPGTTFYKWLEDNDCLTKDGRPNYPGLSTEKIYRLNKWMLKKWYMSPQFFWRMLKRPYDWKMLIRSAIWFIPYVFSKEKKETVDLEW